MTWTRQIRDELLGDENSFSTRYCGWLVRTKDLLPTPRAKTLARLIVRRLTVLAENAVAHGAPGNQPPPGWSFPWTVVSRLTDETGKRLCFKRRIALFHKPDDDSFHIGFATDGQGNMCAADLGLDQAIVAALADHGVHANGAGENPGFGYFICPVAGQGRLLQALRGRHPVAVAIRAMNVHEDIFSGSDEDKNWREYCRANGFELAGVKVSNDPQHQIRHWPPPRDRVAPPTTSELPGPETQSDMNINTILYGPPGTGKTHSTVVAALASIGGESDAATAFTAIQEGRLDPSDGQTRTNLRDAFSAKVDSGRIVFTTFHQSYSYEDFIEGVRVTTRDKQAHYEIRNGIFKQLARKALFYKVHSHLAFAPDEPSGQQPSDAGQAATLPEEADKDLLEQAAEFYATKSDVTLQCCLRPESSNDGGQARISSNEERLHAKTLFTGELRAVLDGLLDKSMLGEVEWKKPSKPAERFVMIIDEINRGNISKIFGELITLIEDTKRYGSDEYLSVTLPYSGEQFVVPDNLYLIGTMNTADRSLATLDVALRRRFEFVEMMPAPEFLSGVKVDGIDMNQWLTELNRRIQLLRGREFTIGHALFRELKDEQKQSMKTLSKIMRRGILPLLDEYFFEDWRGIRKVLGDTDGKDGEVEGPHFVEMERDEMGLLGRQGGACYRWNFETLKDPSAYIRLYSQGKSGDGNAAGTGN